MVVGKRSRNRSGADGGAGGVGVVIDDDRVDLLLHALADATRRDIVRQVMGAEHSVSELARRYPMSFAAVHKHVAVLERADLITKHRSGREQLVRCNIDAIRTAQHVLDQLEELWLGRMQRFADVLADDTTGEHS